MDFSSFFDYPEMESDSTTETDDLTFLGAWDTHKWNKLFQYTQTRLFSKGEFVIKAGETDRAIHLVSYGTLEVLLPKQGHNYTRFGTIEEGSVLGEQTFLDGKPRSAMIRAEDESQTLYLSLDAFEIFAAHEPQL